MSHDTNVQRRSTVIEVSLYSALLTGTILGTYVGFNRYLRQIKSATDIPTNFIKKRWLYGKVTAVGDGDNFHLFHLPGGALGGWGWLRPIPKLEANDILFTSNDNKLTANNKNKMKNKKKSKISVVDLWQFWFPTRRQKVKQMSQYYMNLEPKWKGRRNLGTISVRLCGIDAPERAHFGSKSQPFSDEALNWLRWQLLNKRVWIKPLRIDQYNRCVAKCIYWTWTRGFRDLSLQMLEEGLVVVYEGKSGAEFDGKEKLYRMYELVAKYRRKGLWIQRKIETPGEFKRKL